MTTEMSMQDIFETCAVHVLSQEQLSGKTAYGYDRFTPKLKDAVGRSCALGCLIHDNEYKKNMEGEDPANLLAGYLNDDTVDEDFIVFLDFVRNNMHDNHIKDKEGFSFTDKEKLLEYIVERFNKHYPDEINTQPLIEYAEKYLGISLNNK